MHTALLTIEKGDEARARAQALMRLREWDTQPHRAHVWTTLGHATLLAHLACDHGYAEFVPALLERLLPFVDRIAEIGEVGVVGPVALATARLRALTGDTDGALADLAAAEDIAARTGGVPVLLRCRLLRAELAPPGPQRQAVARALAADADALGMRGVADLARRLA